MRWLLNVLVQWFAQLNSRAAREGLVNEDAKAKAELLHRAARYEAEGFWGIARHLRQQAEMIHDPNFPKPPASSGASSLEIANAAGQPGKSDPDAERLPPEAQ